MIGDELEERVRRFSNAVVREALAVGKGRGAAHMAEQLLRAATRARAHYSEARGAESRDDFIHKLGVALKELRETVTWLDSLEAAGYLDPSRTAELLAEADELIAIFFASRKTAAKNGRDPDESTD